MSKIITVQLGGQERTLDVGKFWFTKFLGDSTGADPLNGKVSDFEWAVGLVNAGMLCDYKVNKKVVDFTKADVEEWVGSLEIEDVTGLINRYLEATKVEAPGETTPQA